ncbi:MAG: efflux RND transporter periplasmic adaptor subunit [Acidobacteria bacterium]|nr:efflux RND transporter periplasmic adaptor subunit [Acidobacteriota bacterium]
MRRATHVERPDYVTASGSVEAAQTVEVAFQIAGKVARVLVEEGQAVRRGQLLAELDGTDYSHAVDAASAQAQAAEAVARKAANGARPQELEQARIDFDRWADEYKRMKFLYDRKSLPPNDFKKVEAAYNAARERYEMAKEGTRVEDKAAAEAQRRAAEAQAAEARKRLSDTQLRAPASGYIGMRRIEAGQTVGAGQPVLAILDLNPVKVRVGIPEAEIGKVRPGARAEITIPSLADRKFPGAVELIGVAADPAARTFAVKVTVPNPKRELLAGMVSEARIIGTATVKALSLPGEAIVHDAQGATQVFVYYPDRGRVYAKRVEVGGPLTNELEIRGGLSGGELVVIAGQQNVREGSAVRVEREQ